MKKRSEFPWYLDGYKVRVVFKGCQIIGTVLESFSQTNGRIKHLVDFECNVLIEGQEYIGCFVYEDGEDHSEYTKDLLEIY